MSQESTLPTVTWPELQFGPVNLWSLPADWKRDPLVARQLPARAPRTHAADQANQHSQNICHAGIHHG